ncbi:hypothetical protein, partial [Zoogloea sp.]|uniref:hypothetical protein n=1 Tax=Zoogloea sp. TaxID=49181 RepID=UPI0026085B13
MNMPLPHRIRRLSWQARAPTPAAGLDLRQLLRSSIEPVHNTLEEIIALALPPGQTLRLPRLTVHVHLEEDADETRLLEQLRKAFQSALADPGVAFLTSHDSP